MSNYTPRPGSKTAAAVDYLRAHGGAAKFIDIAEAADTERKNLPSTLKSAIDNGLIEPCDLPDGKGYRLCEAVDGQAAPTLDEALAKIRRDDGDPALVTTLPGPVATLQDPVTTLQDPVTTLPKKAKRAATGKESSSVATPPAADKGTEIRPYLGKMPKAPAGKPRARSATAADHFSGTAKMFSLRTAPPPENKPARIGHFSDGSVCIEGPDDLVKITDDYDANRVSVMLSPEVALQLVKFIGAGE